MDTLRATIRKQITLVTSSSAPRSTTMRLALAACAITAVLAAGYGLGWWEGRPAERARAAERPQKAPVATLVLASEEVSDTSDRLRSSIAVLERKPYDLTAFAGRVITHVQSREKAVALTFDDGPSANTAEVLDLLERHHAGATFFFVGSRVDRHATEARRVVDEGFEIGDHTWTHAMLVGLTPDEVREQVGRTQDEIERVTGVRPDFVRARSGKTDAVARRVVGDMHLVLANWSASGEDSFEYGNTPADIERFALGQTRAGSVILLHETNPATIQALPGILDRLERDGYRILTLGELLTGR